MTNKTRNKKIKEIQSDIHDIKKQLNQINLVLDNIIDSVGTLQNDDDIIIPDDDENYEFGVFAN